MIQRKPSRAGFLPLVALALLVAAFLTLQIIYPGPKTDRIITGLEVVGVKVGGLTLEQADQYLAPYLERLLDEPIILTDRTTSTRISPRAELGFSTDINQILTEAYAVGRSGRFFERLIDRFRAHREGVLLVPELSYSVEEIEEHLFEFLSQYQREARDAAFAVRGNKPVIAPEQWGTAVDTNSMIDDLAAKIWQPTNRVVFVPIEYQQPAVTQGDLESLGINSRIASFTTSFNPSQVNRVTNIRIAAEALSGMLLLPGEELSFNQVVGPRIATGGYLEAPVIIQGKLVPDIGGGVCQVSSTLFNALLLAGMDISYRAPHSIPSTYVDLGRDATVADGLIDLKMTNQTERAILIQSRVSKDKLEIAVYGQELAVSYHLYTRITETKPHQSERIEDHSIPPGIEVVTPGRDGYRVVLFRDTKRDGKLIKREQLALSTYPPKPEVINYRP